MPATTSPARHRDKIRAVLLELREEERLPGWLRDAEVRHRVETRLREKGCTGAELPSLTTWKRELPKLRELWRPAGGS